MHPTDFKKIINKDDLNKNPFERLIITCADKNNKKLN